MCLIQAVLRRNKPRQAVENRPPVTLYINSRLCLCVERISGPVVLPPADCAAYSDSWGHPCCDSSPLRLSWRCRRPYQIFLRCSNLSRHPSRAQFLKETKNNLGSNALWAPGTLCPVGYSRNSRSPSLGLTPVIMLMVVKSQRRNLVLISVDKKKKKETLSSPFSFFNFSSKCAYPARRKR